MNPWFEVAIVATFFAIGNILFGHFEAETPKWRRVLKVILALALTWLLATELGRAWTFAFIGVLIVSALVVHAWWLPRHGINGWTGEPKAKYYEFRGWTPPPSE